MQPATRHFLTMAAVKAVIGFGLIAYCGLMMVEHRTHAISVYEEFKSKHLINESIEADLKASDGYSIEQRMANLGRIENKLEVLTYLLLIITIGSVLNDYMRLRKQSPEYPTT